jgi:hypothetical protein
VSVIRFRSREPSRNSRPMKIAAGEVITRFSTRESARAPGAQQSAIRTVTAADARGLHPDLMGLYSASGLPRFTPDRSTLPTLDV